MRTLYFTVFVLVLLLVFLPSAHAFGAGEIPEYAFLKGKSFRHGDIENVLADIAKKSAKAAGGGFMSSFLGSNAGGGKKFSAADIKHVYFGNWLRDYSQAMDIAGLSKLSRETIIMVLSVLSFMTFGYATEEYELTAERLGVYLPVEHIDNPKGYAEKEGDARQYHPALRPPVRNEELEVDLRTGMKNYIANENGFWDTSTACVRRNLGRAIELARSCQLEKGASLHEAYRLLGTGLHTLEDLLAHSNWVELTLHKMGYEDVFLYVGDNVRLNTPRGYAAPLVTGTFGSADFMFSVMSEGTDKISQNSLGDLNSHFGASESEANAKVDVLKSLISQLPSASSEEGKMQQAEQMKQDAYHFDPNQYSSQQTQQKIWEALVWRDGVMRDVEAIIAGIPGLEKLVDELMQAATVYVYSIIQPYIMPYLKEVANVLTKQSKAVVDEDAAQFEVFDDPYASDPTHSMLSKDHFDNILNEPAGKVAEVVVRHTVELVVEAWSDPNVDIEATLDEIMKAFHHPFFADSRSPIHTSMEQVIVNWFGELAEDEQAETLQRLTKESIRHGKNKRLGTPDDEPLRHDHGQGAFSFAPGEQYQDPFKKSGYGGMPSHPSGYDGGHSGGYGEDYLPAPGSGSHQYGDYSSKQYSESHSYGGQYSAQSYQSSSYHYQGSQEHTYYASHEQQHSSHGGGGGSGFGAAALGGMAGLAGGVLLAQAGEELEENLEDAVDDAEEAYEEAEDYAEDAYEEAEEAYDDDAENEWDG